MLEFLWSGSNRPSRTDDCPAPENSAPLSEGCRPRAHSGAPPCTVTVDADYRRPAAFDVKESILVIEKGAGIPLPAPLLPTCAFA